MQAPEPETYTTEELGELARHLRRQAEVTQRQLGDRLGVSQAAVSLAEKGETGYLKVLFRIILVLGERVVDETPRFRVGPPL